MFSKNDFFPKFLCAVELSFRINIAKAALAGRLSLCMLGTFSHRQCSVYFTFLPLLPSHLPQLAYRVKSSDNFLEYKKKYFFRDKHLMIQLDLLYYMS